MAYEPKNPVQDVLVVYSLSSLVERKKGPFRHASAKPVAFSVPLLAMITFLLLRPNQGPYLEETLLRASSILT